LAKNAQEAVPGDIMLGHLMLVLKRSPQRQRAFELFLREQQDSASRNYHHWLTPVQIGRRYGVSRHDVDAVSEWLRDQGMRVDSVANSRMMIDFSGNASVVDAAFGIKLRYYMVGGEQRMATARDPQIPAALAGVIQSVSGLYTTKDRPHYHYGAGRTKLSAQGAGSVLPSAKLNCSGGDCNYFIFPADFATIYDLNSIYDQGVDGTGQTIAIIGRARVYNPDIENFESLSGLAVKVPTVIVPPLGDDPGPPAGTGGIASNDQVEATLDVMRATSVAPGADIDLIVSTDDNGESGLRIAAAYAVDTNPIPAQIMNISFGACEADRSKSDVQFWDSLFSQAAGEGISVFVASGDAGAAGCDKYFETPPEKQIASPNYICASSYATCVGGTEFADAAGPTNYWSQSNGNGYESALGYIPEGAFNEPLDYQGVVQAASSGGGVSAYIATPYWQTGPGVPGTAGRYTPDIAFSASSHDGYFGCLAATPPPSGNCVVKNGGFSFEYFFGTSAAAPDMAGIAALLNENFQSAQGALNPRLYQLAANSANAVFHDVTVGSSGVSGCVATTPSMCNNSTPSPKGLSGGLSGYMVTPGFDEVTGLGSIDGANLLANWMTSVTAPVKQVPVVAP
jgi:subtilase family serine protease